MHLYRNATYWFIAVDFKTDIFTQLNIKSRILIVDDDDSSCRSLSLILKRKGYDVEIAGTATEALDLVQENVFHICLLDIKLPDMEGVELLAQLREIHPDMDAIMVTGYASMENAVSALNQGAAGYITKPLNMDELLTKLKYILEKKHLVAEKRCTEEKLRKSIEEKDVLLKEIHHRVKNNMQIIYGLINLQSEQISDEKVLDLLKETQYRIRSMALIHEQLYQSKNLAEIEFGGYIQKLVNGLLHSYGFSPGMIKAMIKADNVFVDINTAIPCGLIINELVSNSLKHAFCFDEKERGKNFPSGKICVKLSLGKDNKYLLEVSDNGRGFPKEIDFRSTKSLGLQIVNTLVDQLEGHINLQRKNGTSFRIGFTS